MSGQEGFEMALSLDGRPHDFVLGVEIGRLWEQLSDPQAFEQTIHAENLEIVMRMREATGRQITVEDSTDDAWCHLLVAASGENDERKRP